MSLPADKFNCPSLDHVLLLVSEVEEFKFPNPGDYKIQITIDGEKCGETVFSLNFPTGEDSTAKAEADSSQPS
jgi:hypothetical protein